MKGLFKSNSISAKRVRPGIKKDKKTEQHHLNKKEETPLFNISFLQKSGSQKIKLLFVQIHQITKISAHVSKKSTIFLHFKIH